MRLTERLTEIKTHVLKGFDAPALMPGQWDKLLKESETKAVFLTPHWQRIWWESFGRGKLILLGVEREGEWVVLAPLFADEGMIFFVGSGNSDYLDFIGDTSDPEILTAVLDQARALVPDFLGFKFYHVPDESGTGARLQIAAERLGLICYDEGELSAPYLDLCAHPEAGRDAANRTSLLRHERFFERQGKLEIHHFKESEAILPHLEKFFTQHVSRWQGTPYPSLFLDSKERHFYESLAQNASEAEWLRFCRIDWDGQPIAFHFGFYYAGSFLWYKPSFDIALAKRSPGEVLLRQLLLAAIKEGARTFDFGLGDEVFKHRFANQTRRVRTWGVYPKP